MPSGNAGTGDILAVAWFTRHAGNPTARAGTARHYRVALARRQAGWRLGVATAAPAVLHDAVRAGWAVAAVASCRRHRVAPARPYYRARQGAAAPRAFGSIINGAARTSAMSAGAAAARAGRLLAVAAVLAASSLSLPAEPHGMPQPALAQAGVGSSPPPSPDPASLPPPPGAAADALDAFTNSRVYAAGQPLFVSGTAIPGETLIVRVFAPDGTILSFSQVEAHAEDGSYSVGILVWPEPSSTFPYGTYVVEVISTRQNGLSVPIDVRFSSTDELVDVPVSRHVDTRVFVPETAGIGSPLRIFVQVTSDGSLVGGDPAELLDRTHVHLPGGQVSVMSEEFRALHQGLYYADYTPEQLGTYVFHIVTFHQGTVSHGSAATNVMSQDIGGISDHVERLGSIMADTSVELDRLKTDVSEFDSALREASADLESNVGSISESVANVEEASGQLNSLLFPIVGAIGVIAALQIVLLARSR